MPALIRRVCERNTRITLLKEPTLKKGAAGLTAVVLVVVGVVAIQHLKEFGEPGRSAATSNDDPSQERAVAERDLRVVTLPPGKSSSAEIQVTAVVRRTLQHVHSVPGRVAYDDNRHIEVTAPTGGILTQVLVMPGDTVKSGQVLAWLNSPEIGSARADVLQHQAKAELAATLAQRASTREKNVIALADSLKKQPDFDELRNQFSTRTLGDYREQLFAAYAEMKVAESLAKSAAGLVNSGVLAGKTMQERQAAARSARAKLEAACEQAVLDVGKDHTQAKAAADDARRRYEIAKQHLASLLLIDAALRTDTDTPQTLELGASDSDIENLSRVAVRAPFGGTIERRMFSASERVNATNAMFVLADTSTLWIKAEIRENDWPAVAVRPGQKLQVTVPALGNASLEVTVEYIGREVASDTNAVPIVAVVKNEDRRLRPGLFVRVAVPVDVRTDVLTVPKQSVLQHDGVSFVFVADETNRYRRVDVTTGDTGGDNIEIIRGLRSGDRVVTRGAFILKSELLLEAEEE